MTRRDLRAPRDTGGVLGGEIERTFKVKRKKEKLYQALYIRMALGEDEARRVITVQFLSSRVSALLHIRYVCK